MTNRSLNDVTILAKELERWFDSAKEIARDWVDFKNEASNILHLLEIPKHTPTGDAMRSIIGLLEPIANREWDGKWRIIKAIGMLQVMGEATPYGVLSAEEDRQKPCPSPANLMHQQSYWDLANGVRPSESMGGAKPGKLYNTDAESLQSGENVASREIRLSKEAKEYPTKDKGLHPLSIGAQNCIRTTEPDRCPKGGSHEMVPADGTWGEHCRKCFVVPNFAAFKPVSVPLEVAAKALHQSHMDELEDEYTEAWEDVFDKDYYRTKVKAVLTAAEVTYVD